MSASARDVEQTCGAELAASAEVPEKWGALMAHVAANTETHATWMGNGSEAARRERDGLLRVAAAYRGEPPVPDQPRWCSDSPGK